MLRPKGSHWDNTSSSLACFCWIVCSWRRDCFLYCTTLSYQVNKPRPGCLACLRSWCGWFKPEVCGLDLPAGVLGHCGRPSPAGLKLEQNPCSQMGLDVVRPFLSLTCSQPRSSEKLDTHPWYLSALHFFGLWLIVQGIVSPQVTHISILASKISRPLGLLF